MEIEGASSPESILTSDVAPVRFQTKDSEGNAVEKVISPRPDSAREAKKSMERSLQAHREQELHRIGLHPNQQKVVSGME